MKSKQQAPSTSAHLQARLATTRIAQQGSHNRKKKALAAFVAPSPLRCGPFLLRRGALRLLQYSARARQVVVRVTISETLMHYSQAGHFGKIDDGFAKGGEKKVRLSKQTSRTTPKTKHGFKNN